jgi:hypothetical protein
MHVSFLQQGSNLAIHFDLDMDVRLNCVLLPSLNLCPAFSDDMVLYFLVKTSEVPCWLDSVES